MTRHAEDAALRQRFEALRGEATRPGRVPDFEGMLARVRAEEAEAPALVAVGGGAAAEGRGAPGARAAPRERAVPASRAAPAYRRFALAGAWASAALAATVAALLLTDRRPNDEAAFEQLVAAYAAGAWRSPTSGLLEVPGMELTRSVPSIGGPVRGLDPATLPEPEPAQPEESL